MKIILGNNLCVKILSVIFLIIFLSSYILSVSGNNEKEKQLYLEGNFKGLAEFLIKDTFEKLTPENKLFYVEALIRSGKNKTARKYLEKTRKIRPEDPETEALEGMSLLASGEFFKAETIINKAARSSPGSVRVIQAKLLLLLYLRRFNEAETWLSRLSGSGREFGNSQLFYLMGMELFRGKGDHFKISGLYSKKLKEKKKLKNKQYYLNLKSNHKLYKKKVVSFFVESKSDKIEIPFETGEKSHMKSILYKLKGKNFRIVLDTGNTTGWAVHSRDLRELLKSSRGGRTVTQIGSESGKLDGFNIYCKTLVFDTFMIRNLFGIYVPKPNPEFFDANLNPIFIKNRAITFDFIKNTFILRSKERFKSDVLNKTDRVVMLIPWFGHKYPLVPILYNKTKGMAVIETGAENIAIQLDKAKELDFPLTEKFKYLSNGKIFKYFLTSAEIQLGKYLFVRNSAEVWPIKKFMNRISGFNPHLILGPVAFEKKFVISFIPYENIIVFEYEEK